MYRFPWYLTLVSTNHASSNPGQTFQGHCCTRSRTRQVNFFQPQIYDTRYLIISAKAQNNGLQVASHDDWPNIFQPGQTPILAGQINEYYNYCFAHGNGIVGIVVQVFAGKLVKNSFTRCSFLRFSPVLCPFIYTFSIIVQQCRKSPRFVLYRHISET